MIIYNRNHRKIHSQKGSVSIEKFINNSYMRDFSGLILRNLDFSDMNLSYKNFSDSDLTGSVFNRAKLNNATFGSAICDSTSFINANLEHVIFTFASLRYANFEYANLRNTKFFEANLIDARFFASKISEATGICPTMFLLADWSCIDNKYLINELMRYDVANHPNPKKFDTWAKDYGYCPYSTTLVTRSANFNECSSIYNKGKSFPAFELMKLIINKYTSIGNKKYTGEIS